MYRKHPHTSTFIIVRSGKNLCVKIRNLCKRVWESDRALGILNVVLSCVDMVLFCVLFHMLNLQLPEEIFVGILGSIIASIIFAFFSKMLKECPKKDENPSGQ